MTAARRACGSGQYACMVIDVEGDSDDTPALYCTSCGTGIPQSAFPEPGSERSLTPARNAASRASWRAFGASEP